MASKKTSAVKSNGKSIAPAGVTSEPKKQTEMKTSEIRDLIDFIAQSGLNEVDIETKELKLHVKREPDQKVLKAAPQVMAAPVTVAPALAAPLTTPAVNTSAPVKAEKITAANTVEIKSPMIGTFYRSANPDSPPFISVGDKVTKGQTVCIIEAMKLFNEIESEVSGTVIKAMVENSTPVEYDQVLFVVEPD
jgi:acetyl-CoA carboxylase biotin carboxyl carrier protein